MHIRWDETSGILDINGVKISANVLSQIVDPDRRALLRFQRGEDGTIEATVYGEQQCVWLDEAEHRDELRTGIGIANQDGNGEF